MPSSTLHNADSKSKKKKAAKTLEPAVVASKDSSALNSPRNGPEEGADFAAAEKEHIRETQKHIRNINKKLNSMAKVDAVIKENPDASLDELVAARKINADQKAQALKKPQLQSQLAQLEEQLATFRKLESEHQAQLAREKHQLAAAHAVELERATQEARGAGAAGARAEAVARERDRLLVFTRFLAAAAMRRNREDQQSQENRAFEGALLLVYGGNAASVFAAQSIIDGAEEKLVGIDDVETEISFKRLRELVLEETPSPGPDPWAETAPKDEEDSSSGSEASSVVANGVAAPALDPSAPPFADGSANAAPAAAGDESPLEESYELVPRAADEARPAAVAVAAAPENEPAPAAQAAAATATATASASASWSDEPVGDMSWSAAGGGTAGASQLTEKSVGDGFHEVSHQQRGGGRSRGSRGDGSRGGPRGGYRGPRGGGGHRGGEHRGGEHRGGEHRGDRGGEHRGGENRGGRARGGFRPRGRGD